MAGKDKVIYIEIRSYETVEMQVKVQDHAHKIAARCVVASRQGVSRRVQNWCTYTVMFFVVKDVGDRVSA